jgi:hypothetical protein
MKRRVKMLLVAAGLGMLMHLGIDIAADLVVLDSILYVQASEREIERARNR